MIIVADASFLVALFTPADEFNVKAWQWWKQMRCPFYSPALAIFEAENTIRGFPVGNKCSVSAAAAAIEGMKRASLEGILVKRDAPIKRLLPQARRLSQFHTTNSTFGALDILHVATALELKSKTFLTFDQRQGALAKAEALDSPFT